MYKLICYLTSIYQYSKTLHYEVEGKEFYGQHLFCDRIADKMNDYIDLIKEVCFLGHQILPPKAKDILFDTVKLMPDVEEGNNSQNFVNLYNLISDTLGHIQSMKGYSVADNNLIGGIAQDLQQNAGLLWREITKYAYETAQERVFMPDVRELIKVSFSEMV